MQLCSKQHDEVCFEARNCPACEAIETTRSEKKQEIEKLQRRISDLEDEVRELYEK